MTQSGNTYYLAYDQVGSLRAVMDSTGAIVKQVDYDSFGSIINDSNSAIAVPFGFAGGLHDRDTGLVRFGARDYDPAIGRWTAKDPIDFAGQDVNLYNYVGNPISFIDPWGLWSISIEGYYGWGGGVVLGKNPDGVLFTSFRFGYGIGGGLSYNPNGKSPGWNPCLKNNGMNIGLGGFGQADVGLGPIYGGLSGNAGINVAPRAPVGFYGDIGLEYGLDMGWHLRGGASVGGEITFH